MAFEGLLNLFSQTKELSSLVKKIERGEKEIWLKGLEGLGKSCLLAFLKSALGGGRPLLVLTQEAGEAQGIEQDLSNFFPGDVYLFPDLELLPYEPGSPSQDLVNQQLLVLERLASASSSPIIISSVRAILPKIIPPQNFLSLKEEISLGKRIRREDLIEKLVQGGYERLPLVEERGTFSLRGGIFDLYPPLYENPLRLEFFGEEVVSIREFDPFSQRSISKLKEISILPLTNLPEADSATLFDYFLKKGLIFLNEPDLLKEKAKKEKERIVRAYEERKERGEAPNPPDSLYSDFSQELPKGRKGRPVIYFSSLAPRGSFDFGLKSIPAYEGELSLFIKEIKRWKEKGYSLAIASEFKGQGERLVEFLREEGLEGIFQEEVKEIFPGQLLVTVGNFQRGFESPSLKLAFITHQEIFGRLHLRRRRGERRKGRPLLSLFELKVGDYAVHTNHGIGMYRGVKTIKVEGKKRDFLLLEYAEEDRLYVPLENINMVQKYIGMEGHPPRIHRLGGRAWAQVKKKVSQSVENLARELLELYALRKTAGGYPFSGDSHWQYEFEAGFIYEETPDQSRATEEVKGDMERGVSMDRLVCGDVGYGKTEVAMRAAFKAVMDGKQVALLVPTTILAQQHFHTFRLRMGVYPINIEMLSRFKKPGEQEEIIQGLARGTVDIVIGTHRLIQKDVHFKDLGLVIIDEEQRFGVRHKERFKELRQEVDVLTLTATPIPRTLYMSLSGARDISLINTPPLGRLPIETYVLEYDEGVATQAILREMGRGGQVFFVHNRVQNIEEMAGHLRRMVPQARIAVAHGQMPERDLEATMLNFLDKKYDILLSTNIIESGLDIPNVNTIIVHQAERFGLAELYQLRGRVGRAKHKAYAYLFYSREGRFLSEIARKRLAALEEFRDLGSGFNIALRDLQIRGAGNILGKEQHGRIMAVGFELYCKLLEEEVNRLKSSPKDKFLKGVEERKGEEKPELAIELKMDAFLPSDYIPDQEQKLVLYRRIISLNSLEEAEDLKREIEDRYGKLPREGRNLLTIASGKDGPSPPR
jgi:transcription-repair coupling factor (superfamily II helicase)